MVLSTQHGNLDIGIVGGALRAATLGGAIGSLVSVSFDPFLRLDRTESLAGLTLPWLDAF